MSIRVDKDSHSSKKMAGPPCIEVFWDIPRTDGNSVPFMNVINIPENGGSSQGPLKSISVGDPLALVHHVCEMLVFVSGPQPEIAEARPKVLVNALHLSVDNSGLHFVRHPWGA